MSESLYTVEKIVDKVFSEKLGKWVYMVKWEGFPDSDNSWEPEENLVPLGKLLENFNKSWELKNKPPVKSSKPAEPAAKKPIVTKVKGLVDQGELNPTSKKPLESSQSKSPYLSSEPLKDSFKNGASSTNKSGNKSSSSNNDQETSKEAKRPAKKTKKVQPTMDEFKDEETVKLVSKKTLEKKEASKEVEIDLNKNLFKNCKVVKPSLAEQVPWKIIGARKRNNVIQYVVVFKGPPVCMPVVVSHDELAEKCPDLICDFVFSSFG